MSFNSVGQYTATFKTWDHLGNIFPNVEHSEGTRPAGEFRVAAWLPVQFFDKYYEDWYVVTPGKILGMDNVGDLCPAAYATGSTSIVYTQNDIDNGVIDVATGAIVASVHSVAVSSVNTFLGASGVNLNVSKPVGVAPYGYLQWAGGDGINPTQLRLHNYNRQHLVAFLTDYVLVLPQVPGVRTTEALTFGSPVANVARATAAHKPIASNTVRTPISFTGTNAALFVNQVASDTNVKASGDWSINQTTGLVAVFKSTAGAPVASMTYYAYDTAPASVSVFACAVGNLKPGDFVKTDGNSNFQAISGSETFQDVMGQVLDVIQFPRSGLQYVKTAFQPALNTGATGSVPGFKGQMDQMPGSATGGVPDQIQFSGASDQLVLINLISR